MKCHECISFADGICRNPQSRRRDVGFFQEACGLAEPETFTEEPAIINQNTMNENENKEENAAPVTYTCKGCGRDLPPDQFYKNRWGLTSYCKDCMEKKKQTGTKSGTKKEGKPEQVGTKSEDLKPASAPAPAEPPIRRQEFAHVATGAVHLESDEIVELMVCLALELRERGYEVTGTVWRKTEI